MLRWRVATRIASLLLAIGCLGCAVVDQYSGRAVGYNIEAELAQQQGLLLNVIRASERRAMQFTSVSSITGSASASGNAGLSAPVGPHSNATPKMLTLGGTISGGPNFTVPVLDTQEFYQGILKPIPAQFIDLYIQAGYTPEILYNLFIEKIVMTKSGGGCGLNTHWKECEFVFKNYPGLDINIELFQALVRYLADLGLTTEPLDQGNSGGGGGGQQSGQGAGGTKQKQTQAGSNDTTGSSSDPLPKAFGFCFAPNDSRNAARYLYTGSFCDPLNGNAEMRKMAQRAMPKTNSIALLKAADSKVSQIKKTSFIPIKAMPSCFVQELIDTARIIADREPTHARGDHEVAHDLEYFKGSPVILTFYTRSTENLIYYLGELTRRQLYPEYNQPPRVFQTRIGHGGSLDVGHVEGNQLCKSANPPSDDTNGGLNLFVIQQGAGLSIAGMYFVDYNASRYFVPGARDPEDSDKYVQGSTTQVLDLTKQLLAINSSAKSLPATNVIAIVGQ